MVITREGLWGGENGGDIGERLHNFSYKMNKFWGSKVQHGDDNAVLYA